MTSRYFWGSSAVLLIVLLSACTAGIDNNLTTTTSQSGSVFTPVPTATSTPITTPTPSPTSSSTPIPNSPSPTSTPISVHTIANGTYTEKASYKSPAQVENVEFSFTVDAGTITNVELLSTSSVATSRKFQGLFIDGIKKEIIGKKLADLGTYSRVNGSSLTPKAFNQALEQLKQE